MKLERILCNIKKDFEDSIITATFAGRLYTNGNLAKEALIRSQKIINYLHEYIKQDFILNGIDPSKIYPPINKCNPEIKIKGFLKSKDQDISILPSSDHIIYAINGDKKTEEILSVNLRSQLSSLQKNIDTLYERTFAEALNLHLKYPKQCLGEVYLIPVYSYDDRDMRNNIVSFTGRSKIETYINMFQAINLRESYKRDNYKYERVCLLIVDFNKKIPKLYSTLEELKKDHLVSEDFNTDVSNLSINTFCKDLIKIYKERFGEIS